MKIKITLTKEQLEITADALHLYRSIAESLYGKLSEPASSIIEETRMIFSDKFYKLIEK